MRDPLGFLAQAVRTHGDIVKLRMGNLNTYVLVNPEHIEYVLRTHHDNFIKDKLTQAISPLVGQGLLTSEGHSGGGRGGWRSRPFSTNIFSDTPVRWLTRRARCSIRGLMVKSEGSMGRSSRLTLKIVARTLFAADVESDAEVVGASLETVMNYFFNPMRWFRIRERLPLPSTRRYWRAIGRIDEIIYGLIGERRASGTTRATCCLD